jgi:phosphate transport system substrate-binding protein
MLTRALRKASLFSLPLMPIVSLSSLLSLQPMASARQLVKVDGSSTVFPITEAVAEEFQKAQKGKVNVTVGISGTGGGFKKFCAGEIDVANASRPITPKEMQACKAAGISYIELPVAFDALTVVVNKANPINTISTDQLKSLYIEGSKLNNWNQVTKNNNTGKITTFAPGKDSGTFDYFREAILDKKDMRDDVTTSEDDNLLVKGVEQTKGGVGFFGLAYYDENKNRLKALAVNDGKGAVKPSAKTVMNGTYRPLSRPLLIYVSTKSMKDPDVQAFVRFYMNKGAGLAKEVGYVPLPGEVYKEALARFNKGKSGTVFSGRNTVGLKIQDIVRLETSE